MNTTDSTLRGAIPTSDTRVEYGFAIIGVYTALSFLLTLIAYGRDRKGLENMINKIEHKNPKSKMISVTLHVWTFVSFWLFLGQECNLSSFLPSFLVIYLGFRKSTASLLMSFYWLAHGLSRLLAMPASTFIRPQWMVLTGVLAVLLCVIALFFSANIHRALPWAASLMIGFACGPFMGSMYNWMSQYSSVTNTLSAASIIGAAAGGITFSPLTAFLFEVKGPKTVLYISMTVCGVLILFYTIFLASMRHYKQNTKDDYGVVSKETTDQETAL